MDIKNENKTRNSMKIQNLKFLNIPKENENKNRRKSLFLIKKNN